MAGLDTASSLRCFFYRVVTALVIVFSVFLAMQIGARREALAVGLRFVYSIR
jgi:hypothetical protein